MGNGKGSPERYHISDSFTLIYNKTQQSQLSSPILRQIEMEGYSG